ncbi:Rpn family recombination-promoting nuclease/putative transposase [bacterium]|nr:Rpn family recombination-promoting nuclease/putative transposase [bacterium]
MLDIRAQDARGRFYNVEVQVEREDGYVERSVYYAAELLTSQLQKGQPFTKLAPTIGISLLDFALFPKQDDLHSVYVLYDVAHQRKLSDVLEMHYIEMIKFKESKPHRLRTPFEKWLHILKYGELYEGDLPAVLQQEEGIKMAIESMNQAFARDEVRELIEARIRFQRDEATRLDRAKQEGLKQGLEQGRREVARNLLLSGASLEMISLATGLSLDDLNRLGSEGN